MPGVAFDLPNGVDKPNPKTGLISRLTNIRKVRSDWWWISLAWPKRQTLSALLGSDSSDGSVRVVLTTGTLLPQIRRPVKKGLS